MINARRFAFMVVRVYTVRAETESGMYRCFQKMNIPLEYSTLHFLCFIQSYPSAEGDAPVRRAAAPRIVGIPSFLPPPETLRGSPGESRR
jgi:hypothetical protein